LLAAHTDSAGLDFHVQLEFLQDHVAKLALATRRKAAWLLTDFWLPELLVHARILLEGKERSRYEEVWQAKSREVIPPKLVVYLDRRAEDMPPAKSHPADERTMRLQPLASELRQEVMKPGQGPYLGLDVADFAWACTEVEAAIQAMGESHG
jgi:hypothetical protein